MGEDEQLIPTGAQFEEPSNEDEEKQNLEPEPEPRPLNTEDDRASDSAEGEEELGPGLWRAEDEGANLSDELLISRLESLIFVSPEPISVRRLARILSVDGKRIRALLGTLGEHYQHRGIVLQEVSGGFQFRSHPDNANVIRNVFKLKPLKLSRAALEALAIVAYRQPLTRVEVEAIRGVDSGGVLKFLFEKGLVRVFGRKEEPGRPIIYGTSQAFLELFGLKSLSDLPALHEFSELWDEHKELIDTEESDERSGRDLFAAEPVSGDLVTEQVGVEQVEDEPLDTEPAEELNDDDES